jgi:hypothetical protein
MWYQNFGATHHITNQVSNLQVSSLHTRNDVVTIRDGLQLPITHVESTILPTEVGNANINDVLVVPRMKKNLLSIFKFCNDNPYNIEFDNQKFVIKD